uniref:Thioredoxin family protein n=1 Tax=Oscillatoriales cyanobacterium SpSt-402 TaxID=2282168 RepID=A0A832H5A9_9CYAN
MTFPRLHLSTSIQRFLNWKTLAALILSVLLTLSSVTWVQPFPAIAGLNDDRYDGDIFALYAGNGSLVPPKYTIEQAVQRQRPALLVLYVDDSSDCKQYSSVVSQLQAFYGRAADFIALRVDSLPVQATYTQTDPGFYYKGVVPQTVLFDGTGKVTLNESGILAFEQVDDAFRNVFDLLPRSESIALKRRSVNEISTEIAK